MRRRGDGTQLRKLPATRPQETPAEAGFREDYLSPAVLRNVGVAEGNGNEGRSPQSDHVGLGAIGVPGIMNLILDMSQLNGG